MRHHACLPVPTLCLSRLDLPSDIESLLPDGSFRHVFCRWWLPADHGASNAVDRQIHLDSPVEGMQAA